jgi:hypothetical protein
MEYSKHNSDYTIIKTLLAHILIFIIMLILVSIFSSFDGLNNYTCIIMFIIILGTYFYSGYILTKTKTPGYKYFGIACLGLIIWIIAYGTSPDFLNYKRYKEAGIWMIYRCYIAGIETPLNFSAFNIADNYSVRSEMYIIAFMPVLASVMQYLGAKYKFSKLSKM